MSELYRGVQIPLKLRSLHRIGNMPLPYVAEWDAPNTGHLARVMGIPFMVCKCTIGIGDAKPGRLCPSRNQQCMDERRCGACGKKIQQKSSIYFFHGNGRETFSEPGVHEECAWFSAQVCAGIQKKIDTMSVYIAREYDILWERYVWMDYTADQPITQLSKPWEEVHTYNGLPAPVGVFHAKPHVLQEIPVKEWLANGRE